MTAFFAADTPVPASAVGWSTCAPLDSTADCCEVVGCGAVESVLPRAMSATVAPRAASACAIAAPIPMEAPVMTATLPLMSRVRVSAVVVDAEGVDGRVRLAGQHVSGRHFC